jgi:hypothetical protein
MPKLVLHTKMDWNIVVRKHFFQGPGLAYRQVTLYLTISVDLWPDKRRGPYEGNYCIHKTCLCVKLLEVSHHAFTSPPLREKSSLYFFSSVVSPVVFESIF